MASDKMTPERAGYRPIRRQYWHIHPRGFANECYTYYAEQDHVSRALAHAGYERLTRRELVRHLAYVNAENDAWGSNRAFGPMRLSDVSNGEVNPWSGLPCGCIDA